MIRHDVAGASEPEGRQLIEHAALVGDARPEHVVKGRDAIGGDQDQRVAGGVHVSYLAATDKRQAGELRI
mgnify:CR=1 FL=1